MTHQAEELLDKLVVCIIQFDPRADHHYGHTQPRKQAAVPLELLEELKAFLVRN